MKTAEEKASEFLKAKYPRWAANGGTNEFSINVMKTLLVEYANQQHEVEMFSIYDVVKIVNNWSMIPAIDEDDIRNYLKRYPLVKSTLTQDKVREAAEKVIDAYKQHSLVGKLIEDAVIELEKALK